jgi:hypothetical protein
MKTTRVVSLHQPLEPGDRKKRCVQDQSMTALRARLRPGQVSALLIGGTSSRFKKGRSQTPSPSPPSAELALKYLVRVMTGPCSAPPLSADCSSLALGRRGWPRGTIHDPALTPIASVTGQRRGLACIPLSVPPWRRWTLECCRRCTCGAAHRVFRRCPRNCDRPCSASDGPLDIAVHNGPQPFAHGR